MPYTPPSRSPALASPSIQDASSHKSLDVPPRSYHYLSPPRSPGGSRPSLPRSSSSRTQRQRETDARENALHNASPAGKTEASKLNIDTEVAQKTFKSGTSGSNSNSSSDDDDPDKADKVDQLKEAVRVSLRANGVSDKSPSSDAQLFGALGRDDSSDSLADKASSDVPKLSKSARKISHSRSSTDSAIVWSPSQSATETPQRLSASDGSEDEADTPAVKPPFVRKKSGELVKPAIRPNMRRKHSSMPGTPTYGGKKGVHFNDDIAQVRHFLKVDRPMAVSAGGSPVETFDEEHEFPFQRTETVLDMHLGNFPRQSFERLSQPVRLDCLTLSPDQKTLVGDVVVANLSFHKSVVARFTFDQWTTTSEVSAEYNADLRRKPAEPGFDLFTFNIRLSDQSDFAKRTMILCIRYNVNGQEHWDNNANDNFKVDFSKKETTVKSVGTRLQHHSQSSQSPPRSRKGSGTADSPDSAPGQAAQSSLKTKPSLDDDFSSGFENGPTFKFRQQGIPQLPDAPPPRRQNATPNQFSSRYDFGASLSAALNDAQAQLGDKSGIKRGDDSHKRSKTPPALSRRMPDTPKTNESPRADGLLANKQPLDSRAYQEFVSKFCFFGSGKPAQSPPQSQEISQTTSRQLSTSNDGQHDEQQLGSSRGRELTSQQPSLTLTKPSPQEPSSTSFKLPAATYGKDSDQWSNQNSIGSRSTSPAPIALRYRDDHHGWYSASAAGPTPQAIHG